MSAHDLGIETSSTGERRARAVALAVGAVFVVVGVLGFVPGVTTHVGDLTFAGHESGAELLGLFQVSGLHNLLHVALGLAGLVASRRATWAVAYLVVGGLAYLGLWIFGLAVDHDSSANVVPLNTADNWLHLGLGVGMVVLGLACSRAQRGGIGTQTPW